MKIHNPRTRSRAAIGITLAAMLSLAACGGADTPAPGDGETSSAAGDAPAEPEEGAGAGGTDQDKFTVMTANENPGLALYLDALADGACSAENAALPIEHQKVAQADTVQKVTLLAGQGALPTHTIAGTALIQPDGDLNKAGLVGDLKSALEGAGTWDNVLPAAASTVEQVYGGMYSMPYQYNIEGIFYNKEIFADHGVDEPQTWDDLVAASATFSEAGITPMAQGGATGWHLTRLLGMHIFRTIGPEAMVDIRDGNAKLTDEGYLAGATALAEYADAGYFGEGFTTRDGDAASNMFLTGKAAMSYDGTWALSAINDPDRNEIGGDAIGFMPFPAVEGGQGSIDQYPANAGAPMIVNAEHFGPKTVDWISCIAENYGHLALEEGGVISGFKVNGDVTSISDNTAEIQERIAGISETVLWFEALMDPKSNSLASTNVTLLTTGKMTPEDYMAELQKSIDAAR